MKRLIVIILVIALLLPVVSLAEYSPGLNMTMYEFLLKYNAIQAALEAPYKVIAKAELWTTWNDYHIAWFTADKDNKTTILLMTKDPSDAQMLTSGLDMIQIFSKNDSDYVPLISVTNRCASVFSSEIFGTPLSPLIISNAISYYYENKCKENQLTAYYPLDENAELALGFFYDGGYYFQISSMDVVK